MTAHGSQYRTLPRPSLLTAYDRSRRDGLLAQVYSSGVLGVDAYLVEVEVDVIRTTGDQVRFSVVGLPDAAVQESRERVRSAIKNSGYSLPMARLTVNLAPADIRKEGPSKGQEQVKRALEVAA